LTIAVGNSDCLLAIREGFDGDALIKLCITAGLRSAAYAPQSEGEIAFDVIYR